MTITHSMYMQKVPFLCTERACVVFFSDFEIRPRKNCVMSKVLQVLWTRGSTKMYIMSTGKVIELIATINKTFIHLMQLFLAKWD